MKKFVLIVAGGRGNRMGSELPKQFIPFSGKPILMHTIETFFHWDASAEIILVLPEDQQSYWRMLCRELNFTVPHIIANGGETRFHSVLNGLGYVKEEGVVGVHDGVRPFVDVSVIEECFRSAMDKKAVIPVIPMIDSIRYIDKEASKPVDRSKYYAVQTPQVFTTEVLKAAYEQSYNPLFTDDASVVEACGVEVTTVEGNRENIKLTEPLDLLVAEAIFSKRKK